MMMKRQFLSFLALGLVALAFAPVSTGQTLYGVDGPAATVWEFEASAPGAPCAQPNPLGAPPWPYLTPPPPTCPPLTPMPGPFPPAGAAIIGDIAVNTITDTVFVTDGAIIGEYVGDPPCGGAVPPGFPVNSFFPPFPIGALTGMGMDSAAGVLWVTDGLFIGGMIPPPAGTCGPAVVAFPPFIAILPAFAGILTDITWDPFTGSFWACDTAGFVHNIAIGGAPAGPPFPVAPGPCFPAGPAVLQGIAYDRATPSPIGSPIPRLWVTDGFVVGYLDIGGAPAGPPGNFYAPTPCSPWPGPPTSGLAMASHGGTYGFPRVATTLTTFGQSVLGSGTFGVEFTGTAPGSTVFAIVGFSFPGPGFFCPPAPAGGTFLWVDPTPPGTVVTIGPLPPGCFAIPAALPAAAALNGLNVFVQAVDVPPGGLPAVDASAGMFFTLTAP
jgi:hypothetical protein